MDTHKITFGPIISRRFGHSLGVDLSPTSKQCNFDCLYCELQPAKAQDFMRDVITPELIIEAIAAALEKLNQEGISLDVLTFTANGEPTLYPHLTQVIRESKKFLPKGIKTLILSNGSLFWQEKVQEALLEFDIVKFSLDSIDERSFKRVDRPHKDIKIAKIKAGIVSFAKVFQGKLIGEILLVSGVNDDLHRARELYEFLKAIRLDRLDIGTIHRPSAHKTTPLSTQEIERFADVFEGICVYLPHTAQAQTPNLRTLQKDEILSQIAHRPLSKHDIDLLYSKQSKCFVDELIESGNLAWVEAGGMRFLKIRR
ncbi:MAG: radical SAM protein [Helicobacter sp.]|nr:radical SAM protein [Helicobacter sp.]MDY5741246.1 radical SAM protein [Helicobacter sp.]